MSFDSQFMISYLSSILTMSLSSTVSEILLLISENLKTVSQQLSIFVILHDIDI